MWKLFVVYHKYVLTETHDDDERIAFVKCNPRFQDEFGRPDLIEADLSVYNPKLQSQETPYHAASFLYHAYKNRLHEGLDYIGFAEYDLKLQPDIADHLDMLTSVHHEQRVIVPLSYRWPLEFLASQVNILAASRQCVSTIVHDYNEFWGTRWSIQELLERNPTICTQQSFFCDIASYERLMRFISHVVEQGLAERKGSRPRPSTLMERYIGIALYLDAQEEHVHIEPLPQIHLGRKEWSYDQRHINMSQ